MKKLFFVLIAVAIMVSPTIIMAQSNQAVVKAETVETVSPTETTQSDGWSLGRGIAVGLATLGAALSAIAAAYGIGKIGAENQLNSARQPEHADTLRSNMIVSSALIEGVAFFAIVVCLLVVFLK